VILQAIGYSGGPTVYKTLYNTAIGNLIVSPEHHSLNPDGWWKNKFVFTYILLNRSHLVTHDINSMNSSSYLD
jgi:hypothetical protein